MSLRLACAVLAGVAAPAFAQVPVPEPFPIGGFLQRASHFARLKHMGANTLVLIPGAEDEVVWAYQAEVWGLRYLVDYVDAVSEGPIPADWPGFVGISYPDEPDGVLGGFPCSPDSPRKVSPDEIATLSTNVGASYPDKPTFLNIICPCLLYTDPPPCLCPPLDYYADYFVSADWVSGDIYPRNFGDSIRDVGRCVDAIRFIVGPDKPVFNYVETNDFCLTDSNPGPSPGETAAEMWSIVVHGGKGIQLFTHQGDGAGLCGAAPNGLAVDAAHQRAIFRVAADVTSRSAAMLSQANPPSYSVVGWHPDVEVGWRVHSYALYVLALNLSGEALTGVTMTIGTSIDPSATAVLPFEGGRTVSLTGDVVLTDDFAPHQFHLYQFAALDDSGCTASEVVDCEAAGCGCLRGLCSGGACSLNCPNLMTDCVGTCVDVFSNTAHCGACGNACSVEQVCRMGACRTENGDGCTAAEASFCSPDGCKQGRCSGGSYPEIDDNGCDPTWAGGCAVWGCGCLNDECSGGGCPVACPLYQMNCGDACVDIANDPANCGWCGNEPTIGSHVCATNETCEAGRCVVVASPSEGEAEGESEAEAESEAESEAEVSSGCACSLGSP